MNVLLVGYEKPASPTSQTSFLGSLTGIPSEDAFVQRIKSQHSWARLLPNTYAVTTNLSAAEFRDSLANTAIGRFFVYDVTNSFWAGNGLPSDVAQWLQNNWRQN
jgi:hypothetical protein